MSAFYKFPRIFICMPLTHRDELVVDERVLMAKQICAKMSHNYYAPVCPVLIGKDLEEHSDKLKEFTYMQWLEWSQAYMSECSEVWVLKMDGWEESSGVQSEIDFADFLDIPIHYKEISEFYEAE